MVYEVIYFFTVLIVLDTAHTLSPMAMAMAMAWSRGDFREVMLRHWPQYIIAPSFVLAVSLAAASQPRPIVDAVVTIYFTWNVYHFGAQNYGLVRLLQMRWGWSWRPDWAFCMAVTIVGMVVVPALANDLWHWRFVNLAIFAIPHWVSEVFLTSWVSTRWKIFAPLILAAGCVGLIWVTPRATGMPVVGVLWVCWRTGLGFVHFIYDGLLSDSETPRSERPLARAYSIYLRGRQVHTHDTSVELCQLEKLDVLWTVGDGGVLNLSAAHRPAPSSGRSVCPNLAGCSLVAAGVIFPRFAV